MNALDVGRSWMLNDSQRRLVEENFGLCYKCAHVHVSNREALYRNGWTFDDLVSLASFALCKAAKLYDSQRGFKFSTLYFRIWNNEVAFEIRKMFTKQRHNPAGILSLDQIVEEGSRTSYIETLADFSGSPEQLLFIQEQSECLEWFLSELKEPAKTIVELRRRGFTQMEISAEVGVTQAHVSRTLKKAFRDMREKMIAFGYNSFEEEGASCKIA